MSNVRLGMLLFLFSEAVFFVFLLVGYINFHEGPGREVMAHGLDVAKTAVFTGFLVLSSLTIWLADRALAKNKFRPFVAWLVVTILFGATFLYGQLSEYARLFQQDITVSRDPLATGFFTVTGFHGLHVAAGLLLLVFLLVWSLIQNKRGRALPASASEGISLYWHFVDIVWIAVFAIVYIWGTR